MAYKNYFKKVHYITAIFLILAIFYLFLKNNFFYFKAKLGSYNQIVPSKPIGLLKRGLGGLSQDEINMNSMLSTSQRGDQFHGQSKVVKKSASSNVIMSGLSVTDIQQRIGKLISLFEKMTSFIELRKKQ